MNMLDQSISCRWQRSDFRISAIFENLVSCYINRDDISHSVTYNETTNDSITLKFSFLTGKVGQLPYGRNASKTTEFFSHAS